MASYANVTWTAGDTITEAKLDAMVANDQSEDAHAANGYIANNNVPYKAKDAGGTARNLINVSTDNDVQIGDGALNNINLVADTGNAKIVTLSLNRQTNVNNYTLYKQVIQFGHGYIAGDTGAGAVTEIVTFPKAYDASVQGVVSTPIVLVSIVGSSPAGTSLSDATGTNGLVFAQARAITDTNFVIILKTGDSSNFANTDNYFYTWMAIGTKDNL